MIVNRLIIAVSMCLLAATADINANESNTDAMWPGTTYNAKIPTFKQVLGYDVGERIANYQEMRRYFEALQQAAPDRIKLFNYATSWEGRELIYAVIGKAKNIKALDDITARTQALADPRVTSKKQADNIIKNLPASVWLQYAVHGNEISTTDSAMFTAYHLLAAQNQSTNQNILDNTLVFIDPLQNPDGRERFVSRYYATAGMQHSADRLSAEHNEPWPRGRVNHYLFDMNRDWLALTQPETQGKVSVINKHKPQVVVDLHEMGGDQSFYFAPAAQPFNPFMTEKQIANMDAIGRNHAKHFDKFGHDYFTREIFDAFYPGYGDSWPVFYGASASTYEVGSSRGHLFEKKTGDTLTFLNTVQRNFIASISTAEGTANARKKILADFYQYQRNAIAAGKKSEERVYIMADETNREGNHRLATLMAKHGVEVQQATANFKACGVNYKAGSYFIDTAQPRGMFVKTTFANQVDIAEDFIKEQERRRARNLGDQIYDVTGWSLPMMFNVDTNTCDDQIKVASNKVNQQHNLVGKVINPNASVAYLVAWGDMASARFLTAALQAGINLKSADEAFVLNGKSSYPAGSLVIETRLNDDTLLTKINNIAKQTGAIVEGVNTSWVTDGPSFGSGKSVPMVAPKIAIAWDTPTSELSAGNTRFVIERQLGYPVTAIRTPMLAWADLSDYQVLILPEGNYQRALGKSGAENLKHWVQGGGTLIALGSANRFTSNAEYGLLDIKRENAFRKEKPSSKNDDSENKIAGQLFESKSDLAKSIVEAETSPDYVAGVLANIEVDQEHWLTAGIDKKLVTVAYGRDIYTPITLNSGKNLAWFAAKDEVLASGYLWEQNKAQLAYKPLLVHQPQGKGMVIGFTQSPTYRAYLEGMNLLLTNTIFRAAAHAKSGRNN
ncbi:M14 family metallopeptidase [Colwellia sp. 6_MG-2023]|uniref:M14 family metallopeptidase n=1 Tax=Colwellia sp. 6_MG-2023 TaxID=3062676 RepID=UPI0026E1C0FC|nr:M14 family metallopeptidase [Colwellia sp. 6_MG-2023]MDO6488627.1 M14 family metallopeptidase [Colwellia sp. 6_MG-2023]